MRTVDRRPIRYSAAAMSALVGVIYLLIGLNVVTVVTNQEPGLVPPMLIAGVLFALLAVLTLASTKTVIWVAGAGLQVLVIAGYFAISSERVPAFEVWGVLLKLLQVFLLVAFAYLAIFRMARPVAGSHSP
jgi:hypothetical protein